MRIRQIIFLTPFLTLLACSNQQPQPSESDLLSASQRITITTAEHVFNGYSPASLRATFGGTPTFVLGFSGGFEKQVWAASVNVTPDEIKSGHGMALVSAVPLSEATIQIGVGGSVSQSATSGSVSFDLSRKRLAATATVEPSNISAAIQGELSIECWVPRSALDAGGSESDGNETFIMDRGMQSPQCASFNQWLK